MCPPILDRVLTRPKGTQAKVPGASEMCAARRIWEDRPRTAENWYERMGYRCVDFARFSCSAACRNTDFPTHERQCKREALGAKKVDMGMLGKLRGNHSIVTPSANEMRGLTDATENGAMAWDDEIRVVAGRTVDLTPTQVGLQASSQFFKHASHLPPVAFGPGTMCSRV